MRLLREIVLMKSQLRWVGGREGGREGGRDRAGWEGGRAPAAEREGGRTAEL
jgi:hypothetical protein